MVSWENAFQVTIIFLLSSLSPPWSRAAYWMTAFSASPSTQPCALLHHRKTMNWEFLQVGKISPRVTKLTVLVSVLCWAPSPKDGTAAGSGSWWGIGSGGCWVWFFSAGDFEQSVRSIFEASQPMRVKKDSAWPCLAHLLTHNSKIFPLQWSLI
jgi:hypothetical protein